MSYRIVLLLLGLTVVGPAAQAANITVPYTGSYDEAAVPAQGGLPAGDYDTIGGLPDVGLFNLVDGANTFEGSIWSPGDTSDVFNIGIGPNQTLIGASIAFGTNLSPFAPMFAFPAPHWTLEESDTTPTIFDTPVGADGLTTTDTADFTFTRGEGIYSVLIGNGTFGINTGNFDTPIDYTMTYTVRQTGGSVPVPASLPLFAAGLAGLALAARRRRRDS